MCIQVSNRTAGSGVHLITTGCVCVCTASEHFTGIGIQLTSRCINLLSQTDTLCLSDEALSPSARNICLSDEGLGIAASGMRQAQQLREASKGNRCR